MEHLQGNQISLIYRSTRVPIGLIFKKMVGRKLVHAGIRFEDSLPLLVFGV